MVMMPFFGMMIDEFITDFAFEHTPEFLEKLQGAVDGRLVNAGSPGLNIIKDILCGQV